MTREDDNTGLRSGRPSYACDMLVGRALTVRFDNVKLFDPSIRSESALHWRICKAYGSRRVRFIGGRRKFEHNGEGPKEVPMRGLLVLLVVTVAVIYVVMNPEQIGSLAEWAMMKLHR